MSAPQYSAQFAEARKLFGLVQTSVPGPTPSARQARCSPAVALLTATACCTACRAANAASKAGIWGPWVRKGERSVATTAAMSSSEMVWQL